MHLMQCEITMEEMMIMMNIKSYFELVELNTFEERYKYLQLNGIVGVETFGFDRYLNQILYRSKEWKDIRDYVIIRDNGCDLGAKGHEIYGKILIHHINPISIEDIQTRSRFLLDPEFLITTTLITHNAIHYSNSSLLIKNPEERLTINCQ